MAEETESTTTTTEATAPETETTAVGNADDSKKIFSLKEVEEHNDQDSIWVVIKNNVYDVTKFLEEHPGGEEVLLEQAGKEATDAFEDVGHSTDAREMMKEYKIGEITEEDKMFLEKRNKATWDAENSANSSWSTWMIPVGIALAATVLYRFYLATSAAPAANVHSP